MAQQRGNKTYCKSSRLDNDMIKEKYVVKNKHLLKLRLLGRQNLVGGGSRVRNF